MDDYKPVENQITKRYAQGHEVHRREITGMEATIAVQMLERWGPVAGMPDGYDEAGRQKLRLPEPAELVGRALDIACELVSQARDRGLMVSLPEISDE